MDEALELARVVLEGDAVRAKSMAQHIMHSREKALIEHMKEEERRAEEDEKRIHARLQRKAAYDTWHPVLAPLFRKAGRHLNSGWQWQRAMDNAGLNTRGANFGGCHTAMIVEELVLHAVGIRDAPSGMSLTKTPKDPDMKQVDLMCSRIAASKNSKQQTLQEWQALQRRK